VTVDGRRMTRYAGMVWIKENFDRENCASNKAEQGTPKPQKDGKRLSKGQEFKDGLRDRGLKR
jgi:hypothetical protein